MAKTACSVRAGSRRTEGTEIIKGTLTTRGRPNTRPRSMSEGGWHGPAKVLSEPVTLTLSGRGSTRTSLKSLLSLRRFSRTRPPVATLTWAGGGRSLSLPRSACMAGQYVGGLRAVVGRSRAAAVASRTRGRPPSADCAIGGPRAVEEVVAPAARPLVTTSIRDAPGVGDSVFVAR